MKVMLGSGEPARDVGARGGPERSGGPPRGNAADTEVEGRAKRRRFTAEYKLEILKEADACHEPGEIGELLRREGLYSSHLVSWRRDRDRGARATLSRKRGRKPRDSALEKETRRLQQELARLRRDLEQAHLIIEFQKKVAEILEIPLGRPPELEHDGSES